MSHQHKVEDTRLRSVLKALTGRALEISIGSLVIALALGADLAVSAGIAIFNETICAILSYFNDRGWNRMQWGRKVKDTTKISFPMEYKSYYKPNKGDFVVFRREDIEKLKQELGIENAEK